MKNLKFFLPFAALGLLASCSNDNLGDPTPTPEPGQEIDGMYATFNVVLPTVAEKRAATYPTYDEGTEAEYAIDNMYLYLFKAPTTNDLEGEATFHGVYQLGLLKEDPGSDAITLTRTVTLQMTNVDKATYDGNEFYGLVIVNQPADFTTKAPTTTGSQKFENWNLTTSFGATYRAQESAITGTGLGTRANEMMPILSNGKTYFTMTNAPFINEDKDAITTLVKLNKGEFKTSPAAATKSAGTFYVQRGVAKVTVKKGSSGTDFTTDNTDIEVEGQSAHKFIMNGWALDQTETTEYPVQVVEGTSAFTGNGAWAGDHFVHNTAVADDLYQIWWAKTKNYNEGTVSLMTYETVKTSNPIWNTPSQVEYALENTMDAKKMIRNRTTRAVFKGVYALDGTTGVDFVMYPGTDKAVSVAGLVNDDLSGLQDEDGTYTLQDLIKAEKLNDIVKALGAASAAEKVYYYKDGVTYYTAFIRHFADVDAGAANFTAKDAENDYTNEHLGRYGLLRNNCYQMNIIKVKGYGSPNVPTTDDKPDDYPDPLKYNVQLEINVLNWAKRGYDYTLK